MRGKNVEGIGARLCCGGGSGGQDDLTPKGEGGSTSKNMIVDKRDPRGGRGA